MGEIWKDIPGYEGLYQVSNLGNVKSLFRYRRKLSIQTQPNGYKGVVLYKNGNKKFKLVHRLVAEAFIPNPYKKPAVNHLDENRGNNVVSNLEWVTNKENQNYGNCMLNMAKKQGKPLIQYSANRDKIAEFYSGGDAERKTGVSRYKISLVANGLRNTAGGFVWRFKNV